MSSFSIDTPFSIGDEIQVKWDISNAFPSTTSGATVHIVDLHDAQDLENNPQLVNQLPPYSNINNVTIGGLADNYSGKPNTDAIIAQAGHTTSGAKVCSDIVRTYGEVVYDDWYLPSRYQLSDLYSLRGVLDGPLVANGGDALTKANEHYQFKGYGTSTERPLEDSTNPNTVFSISFNPNSGGGALFYRNKTVRLRSRAVREIQLQPNDPLPQVGDLLGGGIVYKTVSQTTASITPETSLKVSIGQGNTELFTGNNLQNGFTQTVVHTITEIDATNPTISWTYTNSNADPYNWTTNYQVWVKDNAIVTEIQAGSKTTLAWNDDAARWTSRYSYTPEYMSTFKTGIMTFLKGRLYIHDDSQNKNYFYNGFYPTMVTYIDNVSPSQPKVFMNHAVEGDNKPNYTTFETVDNWVMNSDLVLEDYIKREGTYYSELFGDVNDPNVSDNATYGDKLRRGTKLRGQYIKVGMRFDDNDLEVKHSNIGYITSKGHTT